MSKGVIGTWWYPLMRSILLKTVQLCRPLARSCMFGSGYLSGVVMVLRRQWSPQDRQEQSFFGDAQAELDLLMIPAFSSFLKSASAIFSLSGASRHGLANTGRRLPVSMWRSTLCMGEGLSVSDLMMERYFARSRPTGSGMALLTSCSGVSAASESAAMLLKGAQV
jgi:hypothetical protein